MPTVPQEDEFSAYMKAPAKQEAVPASPHPTLAKPSGDAFSRYMAGEGEDKDPLLDLQLKYGSQVSPDVASKVMRLQTRFGTSDDFTIRNLQHLEGIAKDEGIDRAALLKMPVFTQWLKESHVNAAATIDEYAKAGKIESLLTRPASQWKRTDDEVERSARGDARRAMIGAPNMFMGGGRATQMAAEIGDEKAIAAIKNNEEAYYQEALAERQREEAFIASDDKIGFWEKGAGRARENPAFLLPFVSSLPDLAKVNELRQAVNATKKGNATEDQKEMLVRFGRLAAAAERRGMNFGGQVAGILADMPAYAMEFAMTGGTYTMAKGAILKGLTVGARGQIAKAGMSIMRKLEARAIGATVQGLAASPLRIPLNASRRMTSDGEVIETDKGLAYKVNLETGEDAWVAIPKAIADSIIEVGSERAGSALAWADKPLNKVLFGWWASKNPGATVQMFQKAVKAGGVHGILGEMGEERISNLAKSLVGVEDFHWPTLEEAGAEAAAFSAFPFGGAVLSRITKPAPSAPLRDNPSTFREIGTHLQEMKLAKDAPEKMAELGDRFAKAGGRENVYAPIKTFNEWAAKQKDASGNAMAPRDLAAELVGDNGEAYDEALTGQDLVIPTKRWMATIALDKAQRDFWSEELRFDPKNMNGREYKEFLQTQDVELQKAEEITSQVISKLAEREEEFTQEAAKLAKAEADLAVREVEANDLIAQVSEKFGKVFSKTTAEELMTSGVPKELIAKGAGVGAVALDEAAATLGMDGDTLIKKLSEAQETRTKARERAGSKEVPEHILQNIIDREFEATVRELLAAKGKAETAGQAATAEKSLTTDEALKKIGDEIAEKLKAAGYSKIARQVHSAVFRSRANVRSILRGEDPLEIYRRRELAIERKEKPSGKGGLEQAERITPAFYHKIQRIIEEKMGNSATVEQVRGIIKDIKAEEREWSGIDEFLEGKEKITKAELLEFLKANQIEIKEVTLGETNKINRQSKYAIPEVIKIAEQHQGEAENAFLLTLENDGDAYRALMKKFPELEQNEDWAEIVAKDVAGGFENPVDTKFQQYALPGGQNYRELLLTMPDNPDVLFPSFEEWVKKEITDGFQAPHHEEANRNIYESEKRAAIVAAKGKSAKDAFRSSHFSEPNILAHVRFNERTDADGKRVLFIEEIQSDWHQKGRKEGYDLPRVTLESKLITVPREGYLEVQTEDGQFVTNVYKWEGGGLSKTLPTPEEAIAEAHRRLREEPNRTGAQRPQKGVPNAPFKKTWHEFAFKRMLRYAAENGFEKVAWTTGTQQVQRYPEALRQVVDLITWTAPDEAGDRHVQALKGEEVQFKGSLKADGTFISGPAAGKDIAEVFGKGMAEKIASSKEPGKIEGKDFTVGGEGMKGFYDQILPAFANKFGKKYGAKVEGLKLQIDEATGSGRLQFEVVDERGDLYDAFPTRQMAEDAARDAGEGYSVKGEAAVPTSVHALPITDALKDAALSEGFSLFQPGKKTTRGRIRFLQDRDLIELFKDRNLSTLLHEFGHRWLVEIGEDTEFLKAKDPATLNAIQKQFLADGEAILKFLGVDSWENIGEKEQEQWARSFELYLREGKIPNSSLRATFERIGKWFVKIYRNLQSKYFTEFNAHLTDEVREVFGRMLTVEEEIEEAEETQGSEPLDPKLLSMNEEEAARYVKARDNSIAMAKEELFGKLLSEAELKNRKEYKAEREKVVREVTEGLDVLPVYVALDALNSGQIKLNPTSGLYPEAKNRKLKKYFDKDGIDPNTAAEMLGYSSPQEMLSDVALAEPKADAIERIADETMAANHPTLSETGDLSEEAIRAIHNEVSDAPIWLELAALAKASPAALKGAIRKVSRPLPPREEIRRWAEAKMRGKPFSRLNPYLHQLAERRAAKEAGKLLAKGDLDGAYKAKLDQLREHELYRAAMTIKDDVGAVVKYMARFSKEDVRERIAKAGPGFLDQIDAILDRFDFRKSVTGLEREQRKSLAQFIAEEKELDPSFTPLISERLLEDAYRKHYKDMTFEEIEEVEAAVKNLAHLAKTSGELASSKKKAAFKFAVGEMADSVKAHSKVPKKSLEPTGRSGRALKGFFAIHRKFASMARELDGWKDGGPVWEYFVRGMNEAADREASMNATAAKELSALFSDYDAIERFKMQSALHKIFIPELEDSVTRERLIMMALNYGSLDSRQKLIDGISKRLGKQVSEGLILEILDRELTEKDWNLVKGVWKNIDQYWAETKALAERVDGIAPEKIEAAPFNTRFGEMPGGYFPMKYDSTQSDVAEEHEAKEVTERMFTGRAIRATTKHGARMERVKGVKMPVDLSFSVIFQHVAEVIHDQTHFEYIMDANRLIRNPEFSEAVRERYGDITIREMKALIEDVATGGIQAQSSLDRALNKLRRGTTTAILGFKVTTALVQPLGIMSSMVRVGPKWVAKGLAQWARGAAHMENTVKQVTEKSEFMRNRFRTLTREVNEVRNELRAAGQAVSKYQAMAMWMTAKAQMLVDVPTWIGAYEKAISEAKEPQSETEDQEREDRAVQLANQAVLDSQGGGQIKDLARIARGPAFQKLFTMFSNYFITRYNLTRESFGRAKMTPDGLLRLAADMIFLYPAPVVLAFFIKSALRGGGGDDDDDEKLMGEIVADPFQNFMVVREVAAYLQNRQGYRGPAGTKVVIVSGEFLYQAAQSVKDGETDEQFWRSLNDAGGIYFHYPAKQLEAMIRGFNAVDEGRAGIGSVALGPPPRR